jgi:hypothetical protein
MKKVFYGWVAKDVNNIFGWSKPLGGHSLLAFEHDVYEKKGYKVEWEVFTNANYHWPPKRVKITVEDVD